MPRCACHRTPSTHRRACLASSRPFWGARARPAWKVPVSCESKEQMSEGKKHADLHAGDFPGPGCPRTRPSGPRGPGVRDAPGRRPAPGSGCQGRLIPGRREIRRQRNQPHTYCLTGGPATRGDEALVPTGPSAPESQHKLLGSEVLCSARDRPRCGHECPGKVVTSP